MRCNAGKLPDGAEERFVIDIDLVWGDLPITDDVVILTEGSSLIIGVGSSRRLLGSLK